MVSERPGAAEEDPPTFRSHVPAVRVWPGSGRIRGVVLVLHGGRANSFEPVRSRHLSPARMLPFARLLQSRGGPAGLETWTLRNRVRGWNGARMSPVQDARWALQRISEMHPGVPVYLLGHSMGGRTALRVADDPQVRAVVALAPWLDGSAPVQPLSGRRVLILHGDTDRWTSPAESLRFARRLQNLADDVRYVRLGGAGHFMFTKWSAWQELSASYVLDAFARDTGAPVREKYRRRAAALLAQPPFDVVL